MKKIYVAHIMRFVRGGETIQQWRFHFESKELAEEQLKNAKEAGLTGYTHAYTIDNNIFNFKHS